MPTNCIFCRKRRKGSDEHIIAQWLQTELGITKDDIVSQVWSANDALLSTKVVRGKNLTIPTVCGTCNNEWMSRLEEANIPMLKALVKGDVPEVVTDNDRNLLSRWAMKTAIALSHYDQLPIRNADIIRSLVAEQTTPQGYLVFFRLASHPTKFSYGLGGNWATIGPTETRRLPNPRRLAEMPLFRIQLGALELFTVVQPNVDFTFGYPLFLVPLTPLPPKVLAVCNDLPLSEGTVQERHDDLTGRFVLINQPPEVRGVISAKGSDGSVIHWGIIDPGLVPDLVAEFCGEL